MSNYADLLQCAEESARTAGGYALANWQRRNEIIERHAHDLKLVLDRESQDQAESVITHHYPDHDILGEEGSQLTETGSPRWIIDPIDGTVNYSNGLPLWCSCVAVQVKGEVVAGAVFIPVLDECFTATLDGPARLNGEPISVSENGHLNRSIVTTGFSKNVGKERNPFDLMEALGLNVMKVRVQGAAAVDHCFVACGRVDAYLESFIHLWDVAAAGLITRRAGGTTEILAELDDVTYRYLATNGNIHEDLKKLVLPHLT